MKGWMIFKKMGLAGVACVVSMGVCANPVLEGVAHGEVSVTQSQQNTTVNQTSQQAIINWQSFNIQQGEHTHFEQPAGGVALNRINPNQGASEIYGHLSATGQIILVNSAGVFIGSTAYVNVGGLIATTAGLSNEDFLSGHYRFMPLSPDAGMVVNRGTIIAAQHGLIALLGNGVENDGTITAHLGDVVLGSGKSFTLEFAGNELISFNVDSKAVRGITHNGSISANGGMIIISARTVQSVLDNIINLKGVVEAKYVHQHKGQIYISGDPDGGVVRLASRMDVSGKKANEVGGKLEVTGRNILVDHEARLDASGDAGGGIIRIGGNYQGQGPLPNALNTVMLSGASIKADAITSGNGGEIILWADEMTKAYGLLSATGGQLSGNGGIIETSGKHILDVNGISINLAAQHGQVGTWLLDPSDVTISSASSSNVTSGSPFEPGNQSSNSILNVETLQAALEAANVTVQTTAGAGPGSGDITIASVLSWSSATTLLLSAVNDIIVNAAVTAANGSMNIYAASTVNFNSVVQLASLTVNAVTSVFNSATITTGANQTYNSAVSVTGNTTLAFIGGGNLHLGGNVSGSANITVAGGSGTNGLSINTDSAQTWTMDGVNAGTVALSGYTGTLSFNRVENLTGSNRANDTFAFTTNGQITGNINGGGGNTNTLDFTNYALAMTLLLEGSQSRAYRYDGVTLAYFDNMNQLLGRAGLNNQILLTSFSTRYNYTGSRQGTIDGGIAFDNFTVSFSADLVSGVLDQVSVDNGEVVQPGDVENAYAVLDGDVTIVPFRETCATLTFGEEEITANCQG